MKSRKILVFTSALVLCSNTFITSQINEIVNNNSIFAEDIDTQYTGTYGENITYSFSVVQGILNIHLMDFHGLTLKMISNQWLLKRELHLLEIEYFMSINF